jgi:HEAT repeat protein
MLWSSVALRRSIENPEEFMMRKLKFLVAVACVLVGTVTTRADETSAEKLAQTLRSADGSAQLKACEALAAMGPKAKAALPALVEALKSDKADLQWRAALAIGAIGSGADDAVPALTKALASDNPKVRAYAAHALGEIGPAAQSAASALIKLAVDKDQYVRREVRDALPLIGAPKELTRPLMIQTLNDAGPVDAAAAILTLAELGAEIVPQLCEALEDQRACYWACLALSEIGADAKAAVPHLTKILDNEDPEVRIGALIALGEIGKPSAPAVSKIIQLLANDEIDGVRYAAAFALGSIGEKGPAMRALADALDSESEFLRVDSAWALVRLSDKDSPLLDKAVKIIVDAVSSDDVAVRDLALRAVADKRIPREVARPAFRKALAGVTDPEQLELIVDAVASMGADAVEPCINALREKSDQRIHAVRVLIKLGPTAAPAVPVLIATLKDEDAEVRREAEFAIGSIGPEAASATMALVERLSDEDEEVRHAACYAIGKIGPDAKAALPALRKGLKTEDKFLRFASIWAMLKIHANKQELAELAVPLLVDALDDERAHIRAESAYTLGELGSSAQAAIAALKKAMDDDDESVRMAVAEALEKIEK